MSNDKAKDRDSATIRPDNFCHQREYSRGPYICPQFGLGVGNARRKAALINLPQCAEIGTTEISNAEVHTAF